MCTSATGASSPRRGGLHACYNAAKLGCPNPYSQHTQRCLCVVVKSLQCTPNVCINLMQRSFQRSVLAIPSRLQTVAAVEMQRLYSLHTAHFYQPRKQQHPCTPAGSASTAGEQAHTGQRSVSQRPGSKVRAARARAALLKTIPAFCSMRDTADSSPAVTQKSSNL